jgi:hypothetical protein
MGVLGGLPVGSPGDVDFGPGFGIAATAGYRHNAYIAGELDFSYLWLSRTNDFTNLKDTRPFVTDDSKTLESYEITFNLKGYPLALVEVPVVPDWIQPYLRFGFGFGSNDLGDRGQAPFMIRVGGGADLLVFDQLGVYLDGGYTFHTDTLNGTPSPILAGQAQIRVGVLFRF